MYTIRSFNYSDSDYKGAVAVSNADWPDDPTTVTIWKHNDKHRNPKYLNQRFVVETTASTNGVNQIVAQGGCAESAWSYVAGKYGLGYQIHPDYANQGIEEQLYNHILEFLTERDPKPMILNTFMREDRTERVQFYKERGYKVIMRENTSALDVPSFDFTRYVGLPEKVAASGIEILSLPELQAREPEWQQKMYDITMLVDNDVPSPDALTPQPLEEFAKDFKHPNFLPDANFFALDGDEWVGMSTLWKDEALEDKLWVGLTGVLRSHRRRGIATALKLRTIEFAQQYGAKLIETENEENNPMYELNVKLGFKPKPAWLNLRKELANPE